VDDKKLDSWIEEVLGKEPTDGKRHGQWREDIPGLVEDLLASSQQYETEITIRPMGRQEGYGYVVEWEILEYDHNTLEWKPLQGFEESENF
jgi:hypothetical protein